MEFLAGKVGFSHGGLEFLYFVSDPAKPLDGNLRATFVRIASLHLLFVLSCKWGGGNYETICKRLSVDSIGQKVEDVSQLFDTLKVSPGGGVLSDGTVTIRVGSSGV
jgi:hypothetical protein